MPKGINLLTIYFTHHLFTHTCDVPGTVLGTCSGSVTKPDKDGCPDGTYILVGGGSCVVLWKVISPAGGAGGGTDRPGKETAVLGWARQVVV